jgi:anti-anti-sigma factor
MSAGEMVAALPVPDQCPFDVAISDRPDGATVTVTGGLDRPASLLLEDVVDLLCRDHRTHITVDVTGLSAVHCSALAAVTRATATASTAGGALVLTGSTAMARRVIELSRLSLPAPRKAEHDSLPRTG